MNSELVVKYGLLVLSTALLAYFLWDYSCRVDKRNAESFYQDALAGGGLGGAGGAAIDGSSEVVPSESFPQELYRMVPPSDSAKEGPADCFPKDKLTADDLLPKDAANSKWAQVNPAGQGDVKDKNFLNAGFHAGVNTIGSSLRNANRQLRSEPPNPQMQVSPWMQSTIEPDLSRRPLEIGGCDA